MPFVITIKRTSGVEKHRFTTPEQAWFQLGYVCALSAVGDLVPSDYPSSFSPSTVVTLYPRGGDQILDAVATLTEEKPIDIEELLAERAEEHR